MTEFTPGDLFQRDNTFDQVIARLNELSHSTSNPINLLLYYRLAIHRISQLVDVRTTDAQTSERIGRLWIILASLQVPHTE